MNVKSKSIAVLQEATLRLRLVRDVCLLNVNRLLHREYIPNITEQIYVEPTSICNLSCRFCGYGRKKTPKTVMAHDRFCDYVNQATAIGYSEFNLTPLTGEVFTDRGLLDKLLFLEQHPQVSGYSFFSNFTLADDDIIARLFDLAKLKGLTVSLYGHDRDSFITITRSSEKVYRRLIANLLALEKRIPSRRFTLEVGWRSERGFERTASWQRSELRPIIERFRKTHGVRVRISREYNNWGGLIRQEDLEGLDVRIRRPTDVYKNGACALIFFRLLLMADGRVNACACRDVDGTLCIGDLEEQPLREILSVGNDRYMELIEEQQEGRFRPVCRDCDMYKSIYRRRSAYRSHRRPPMTLAEVYGELGARTAGRTSSGDGMDSPAGFP